MEENIPPHVNGADGGIKGLFSSSSTPSSVLLVTAELVFILSIDMPSMTVLAVIYRKLGAPLP